MKPKYILTLIILLGITLRLYKLTEKSLWFDELGEYYASTQSFSQMLSIIQIHLSPPLDYIILFLTLKITPHTDFFIRLPSLVWGVLSIPVIYLLSKKLTKNNGISLLSSFFLAISPLAIQYSQEARMYAFFLFLTIISFYFLIQIEKANLHYYLWILSGIALIYTHYFAFFVFILQLLYLIWKNLSERKFNTLLKGIYGILIIIISFAPWTTILFSQLQNGINGGIIQATFWSSRNFIFLLPFSLIFISYIITKSYHYISIDNENNPTPIFIIAVLIIYLNPIFELTSYYSSQKENWKDMGQHLNINAIDSDTITIIGGLPEFIQLYTSKNLSYQNPEKISGINSKWITVSTQSNKFWGTHIINQNRTDFDNLTQNWQKIEFTQITLYKNSS